VCPAADGGHAFLVREPVKQVELHASKHTRPHRHCSMAQCNTTLLPTKPRQPVHPSRQVPAATLTHAPSIARQLNGACWLANHALQHSWQLCACSRTRTASRPHMPYTPGHNPSPPHQVTLPPCWTYHMECMGGPKQWSHMPADRCKHGSHPAPRIVRLRTRDGSTSHGRMRPCGHFMHERDATAVNTHHSSHKGCCPCAVGHHLPPSPLLPRPAQAAAGRCSLQLLLKVSTRPPGTA
jgi:hypothetical protein